MPFQIKTEPNYTEKTLLFSDASPLVQEISLAHTRALLTVFISATRGRKTQKFTFSHKHLQTAVLTKVSAPTGNRTGHRDAESSQPGFIPAFQEVTGMATPEGSPCSEGLRHSRVNSHQHGGKPRGERQYSTEKKTGLFCHSWAFTHCQEFL